jgi:hypothetical protein
MTAPQRLPKATAEFLSCYLDLDLRPYCPGSTNRPEKKPPRTMNAEIARNRLLNHALITMTAACKQRREQHKRANGGRRAPRVGREYLDRSLLDEYTIFFMPREHLHELLGIELGEAVRYAIAARRARQKNKEVCQARHEALVVTLLRIDQIIEELCTIGLGYPMEDVVDEAIGEAWWYLTGPGTKLPNDLWPPSLEGVYTTLLELLAGVGRWHPSYEYAPLPPGWKLPEEQAARMGRRCLESRLHQQSRLPQRNRCCRASQNSPRMGHDDSVNPPCAG